MTESSEVLAVFTARISMADGEPVVSVPSREPSLGDLSIGDRYRVALFESAQEYDAAQARDASGKDADGGVAPVCEGGEVTVEIEDMGEKGDGIARIGDGYIVFVPGARVGDRVRLEITETRESFAFSEIVDDVTPRR